MADRSTTPTRRLPSFIIGGSPRSGTTYLYNLLDHHPSIFMAKPRAPEPKFFLVDEEYAKGLDYYSERFFADAPANAILGEKSANYLESPAVAERVARDIPAAKLIFILRNPVERAFSNYLWSKRNGHEHLSFEDALEQEETRERAYSPSVRFARPFSFKSRGMYARLLAPYLARFPREQIKILLHDDVVARPAEVLGELLAFVGAPVESVPVDLGERVNSARDAAQQIPAAAREELCELYRHPNRDLERLIDRDLSHWGRA